MPPIHPTTNPCLILIIVISSCTAELTAEEWQAKNFAKAVNQNNSSHASLLKSGICTGSMKISMAPLHEPSLKTVLDCDFRIAFVGDKIRLERSYNLNRLKSEHQPGAWGLENPECSSSVLIANGSNNYWVRRIAGGPTKCMKLIPAWRELLLGNLDCPAHHPIRIWETASRPLQDDDLRFRLTNLSSGGFIARGQGGNWSATCTYDSANPACLNRVAIYEERSLIMEHNLQWEESNGKRYVSDYSLAARKPIGGEPARLRLRIQYNEFQANAAVSDDEFQPGSLGYQRALCLSKMLHSPKNSC